jgi:hypothetical protein
MHTPTFESVERLPGVCVTSFNSRLVSRQVGVFAPEIRYPSTYNGHVPLDIHFEKNSQKIIDIFPRT